MTPHFLFIIFWGYFCYHSSQSLFQVGKNIVMLLTIAGKMPEIAGNEKNGEKIHHPPRVCLETTNVLETWQDSFIFHTS